MKGNHSETTSRNRYKGPTTLCWPLTPHQRQCLLDFFTDLRQTVVSPSGGMKYSSMSCYNLDAYEQRIRVWRWSGHLSDPVFVVERHTVITLGTEMSDTLIRMFTEKYRGNLKKVLHPRVVLGLTFQLGFVVAYVENFCCTGKVGSTKHCLTLIRWHNSTTALEIIIGLQFSPMTFFVFTFVVSAEFQFLISLAQYSYILSLGLNNSNWDTDIALELVKLNEWVNIKKTLYIQLLDDLLVLDVVNLNHGQKLAPPSSNFHNAPMGGYLNHDIFNVHQRLLHGGSSAVLGSNSKHVGSQSVSLTTRLQWPLVKLKSDCHLKRFMSISKPSLEEFLCCPHIASA
ncbi:hypothetical protein TNCV_3518921 [Trichonephila clavipes]|uniref:Uncharacterized protein n=1 Tax=Trichonephila clavipes TaxID=2585209 RepID=A0A8X6SPG5_TRICX|nr:hypothetical protein TNCV_3518921 [Trichonephila clavipes]